MNESEVKQAAAQSAQVNVSRIEVHKSDVISVLCQREETSLLFQRWGLEIDPGKVTNRSAEGVFHVDNGKTHPNLKGKHFITKFESTTLDDTAVNLENLIEAQIVAPFCQFNCRQRCTRGQK